MSLKTRSSFLYGIKISSSNCYLDFMEGTTVYTAELLPGNYTLIGIKKELQRALGSVGLGNYLCTLDRSTRKITIVSDLYFSILTNGNHSGNSCLSVVGITSDKLNVTTCSSDIAIGTLYVPQFPLQNYLSPEDCVSALSESVNESGTTVEIVSIGEKKQCEFSIRYITDLETDGDLLENDSNAVSSIRTFLNYLRTKGPFDLYPDRDNSDQFYTMIMEKNEFSSNGTGFKLYEMKGSAGVDYFETKLITCRVVDA